MERLISAFSKELAQGGGGTPTRHTLEDASDRLNRFEDVLRTHAAWSPILWKNDVRKTANFERASMAAVDWEVDHRQPFPHELYKDPDRFASFVRSLRSDEGPHPDFAHMTEHGVRLIYLLDREIADATDYLELTRRLCIDVAGDLAATGLAVGFTSARHLANHSLVEVSTRC
jgi:hypothetical protein